MRLRNHFRQRVGAQRAWNAVHHAWATALASSINRLLPAGFFAAPNEFVWKDMGSKLPEKHQRVNLQISAARLLIALRLYRQKNGNLPQELKQLLPDFIRELPLDPFDGKPLRYSAEEELIWSVGNTSESSSAATEPDDARISYPIDPR